MERLLVLCRLHWRIIVAVESICRLGGQLVRFASTWSRTHSPPRATAPTWTNAYASFCGLVKTKYRWTDWEHFAGLNVGNCSFDCKFLWAASGCSSRYTFDRTSDGCLRNVGSRSVLDAFYFVDCSGRHGRRHRYRHRRHFAKPYPGCSRRYHHHHHDHDYWHVALIRVSRPSLSCKVLEPRA